MSDQDSHENSMDDENANDDHNSNGSNGEGEDDYDYGHAEEDYDYDNYADEGNSRNSKGGNLDDDQASNHSLLDEWKFREKLEYKIIDPTEYEQLVNDEYTKIYGGGVLYYIAYHTNA